MNEESQIPTKHLPFQAAADQLRNGYIMQLPTWDGWWFEYNSFIIVFTKSNSYHDTPHIEKYNVGNNWTIGKVDYDMAIRMVKALRVSLDDVIKTILWGISPSRESSLVKTELQMASMWLGYLLGEMGAANPYPKSFDASSQVIEKHADLSEEDPYYKQELLGMTKTARVKYLRNHLKILINTLQWLFQAVFFDQVQLKPISPFIPLHTASEAQIHMMNGNLWLGQCLNNIRIAEEDEARKKEEILHKPGDH